LSKEELLLDIGNKIYATRKRSGMSQESLAFEADLDRRTISLYENGSREMGVSQLIKIANALKTPVTSLLKEGEQQHDELSNLFQQLEDMNKEVIIRMMKALVLQQQMQY